MHNRTRVIAAAAITAALAAGSTAAVASTTGGKPGAAAKGAPASGKCTTNSDLAAQLGVSVARFDQAAVAVKTSLSKGSGNVTQTQLDAALARALGIAQARVHQVLAAAGNTCGSQPGRSKSGDPAPGGAKSAGSARDAARAQAAFVAAVAGNLHVSTARVSAALAPLFAAGHAEPSSPAFAAAARSLGVSAGQLRDALTHAKESVAGGR
jgi:hypothetical protein